MARAVSPKEFPALPDGMNAWARSIRVGSVYHAHTMGITACRSIYLDRHKSMATDNLADMQFWGVCPRCFAKAAAA
jgi:hypothetical protein